MKKVMNAIIVVEGKTDVARLSNLVEAEFVITNGSALDENTIDYLKEASKTKRVIVFTDPDFPGEKIRRQLDARIPGLMHCYVEKKDAIGKGKVGIAEAKEIAIMEALDFPFKKEEVAVGHLTPSDLYNIGLIGQNNSKERRQQVSKHFHLGFVNGKALLYRLNSLKITREELLKVTSL